jgi:hypothetical protein
MSITVFLGRSMASALEWPVIACYINTKAAYKALRALYNIKVIENKGIESFLRT